VKEEKRWWRREVEQEGLRLRVTDASIVATSISSSLSYLRTISIYY